MKAIERAKTFSNDKLDELRTCLKGMVPVDDTILTCGSYARREASPASDIDFFVMTSQMSADPIHNLDGGAPSCIEAVRSAINKIVPIEPATGGAFSNTESCGAMLRNIGGEHDNNKKLTRRMLLLLEGEWLFNRDGLKNVRRHILERYIGEGMTDHQLALFLLNDIIRYYRTIAVDYEFKTAEGEGPKPWGVRNIKLIFSRKLLYASGLFSIAMTVDRTRDLKIALLERLFDLPVIDRMEEICGRPQLEAVLISYNHFLERIEDPSVRTELNRLERGSRGNLLFRELKNEGHNFTRELLKLFENTFDSTHPIRRAVIF